MLTARCAWCGRFGAEVITYQLHRTKPEFTRPLCQPCGTQAKERTREARRDAGL